MSSHGTCACGNTFIQVNKVRKYCPECQIIKAQAFCRAPRKCTTCRQKFWSLRSNYHTCVACTPSAHDTIHPCPTCGLHFRLAPGLTSHCLHCVTATKSMRSQYLDALIKRRAERSRDMLSRQLVNGSPQEEPPNELHVQDRSPQLG